MTGSTKPGAWQALRNSPSLAPKLILCFKTVLLRPERASESPEVLLKNASSLAPQPQEILIQFSLPGSQEPAF